MAKIQTSCPNCKNPIVAEIQQVIDVGRAPALKEILLSGGLNYAQCQVCGFQGQLPIPIVYHDPHKEILYTFTPPDLGKTMEEKESALAPLLKNITDNLEPKDRKGYLFQPKTMMSLNSLIKNILLEDGITEDMIQEQQEKMELLDKLFSLEGETLKTTINENNQKIDREFFALFAEIAQRIIASRDEKSIKKVRDVQEMLLEESTIGKEIFSETKEIQAATQSLEALGKNLTRSSLLDLVVKAPTMERVKALTSLVRPAMDYEFFQMFTEQIENTEEGIRKGLIEKRNIMLKLTQEIDQQVQERMNKAKKDIEEVIANESIEENVLKNLDMIDQFFIQALSTELELADKENKKDRKEKLENLLNVIQEITTPIELKVLEHMISIADNKEQLKNEITNLEEEIRTKLGEYLISVINNYEEQMNISKDDEGGSADTLNKLKIVHNAILKISMKKKFSG